jgi:secreted Zn-dependent insulinase-like peptidase
LLSYIEKPDVEGGYQTTFTEKSIDQNKLNIINSLSEEPKNLEAESQSHWQHIVERRLNFDKRK